MILQYRMYTCVHICLLVYTFKVVNFKITTCSIIHIIVQQFNMAHKAHKVRASKQNPVLRTHEGRFTIWCWHHHSVASIGMVLELIQFQLKHYLGSVTNQIFQNLGIRNWIWLVKKYFLLQCSWCSHCQYHIGTGLKLLIHYILHHLM